MENEMSDTISPRQRHILRHALGLEQHGREYRNRYCPGQDAEADCAALEALGLMESYELEWIPGRTYAATDAGKIEARKNDGE
jgi:hypothetical protein